MNYCPALFRLRGGKERRERENRRASNRFVVSDSRIVLALRPKPRFFPLRIELPSSLIFAGTREKKEKREREKKKNETKHIGARYASNALCVRMQMRLVPSERLFVTQSRTYTTTGIVVVDGTGRKRVPPHTFQTFNPFHGMSSPPRLVRLRSRHRAPSVSLSLEFPPDLDGDRVPCHDYLPPSSLCLRLIHFCPRATTNTTTLSVASTFLLIIQLYSTFFND